jgi:hypothetical protein
MKTCPVCQRPYADETLIFCLADGTQLVNVSRRLDLDATWRLSPSMVEPPPTQAAPTVEARQTGEAKPQTTIEYQAGLQAQSGSPAVEARQSRSAVPWIFGMVVVLAASGILIAVILTRAPISEHAQSPTTTQQAPASVSPETKTGGTSDKAQPVNSSAAVTKPTSSANRQAPLPDRKLLIVNANRRRETVNENRRRETANVNSDKKKVEQPKPTGESFIPVRP